MRSCTPNVAYMYINIAYVYVYQYSLHTQASFQWPRAGTSREAGDMVQVRRRRSAVEAVEAREGGCQGTATGSVRTAAHRCGYMTKETYAYSKTEVLCGKRDVLCGKRDIL